MSQRALKKREGNLHRPEKETHQIYRKQTQPLTTQKSKYTQRSSANAAISKYALSKTNHIEGFAKSNIYVSRQKFNSTPNLATNQSQNRNAFARSHSESDLANMPRANALVNAKSEFHLQSIASTDVPIHLTMNTSTTSDCGLEIKAPPTQSSATNQRSNGISVQFGGNFQIGNSTMNTSTFHLATSPTIGIVDTEHIHIPIVGYEVMEERARFTVYKLRIENPFVNRCWLILRRYTDFQRLNNKLRSQFPHLPLNLPRKKIFGDNFSNLFLNSRVQGLQSFINSIMANETLRNSRAARDFFCLDAPPTYSDGIEESRAIFEAQEETINHLKLQLQAKEEMIISLQQQLNSEIEKNCALSTAINFSYENCTNCSKRFDELMKCQISASTSK